jgi:MFS family permease
MSSRLGLLRDHDYRQLFASTTVSQFGVHITRLAIPLVAIMALEASAFEVGLLAALTTAPFLVVGLPAGAWVDRMRRRSVLIAGDLARAAMLATVPVAWWLDVLTMWQLYVVAIGYGIGTVFFDVAYQSYLPHLVGRAKLVEGNSKLEAVRATAELGGPALAGQLIRMLTLPVALLVNAVAIAASALFVARIRSREDKPQRQPGSRLIPEIREGLRFVLRHRLLRAIVTCTATFNLCSSAYFAMLVLYLERYLGLGVGLIGLVLTVTGAGGLLGAFVARRYAAWIGQGPAIWTSAALASPFLLLMPLLAEPGWRLWVAAAGGFAVSVGSVIYNITQVSFRQAITPDRLLGRMNASVRFLVFGTLPLGGLLGGILGDLLGVREALLIAAAVQCLAFLPVFLSPLRAMRTLPTDEAAAGGSRVPAEAADTTS